MVFCVGFEMCGQTLNLLGQERNLYFGGPGISLMYMKLLNDLVFTYRFRHAQPFFFFVLFSFPLTRRFPGVKVIIPVPIATARVATRLRPPIPRRRRAGVPSHLCTRRT